MQHRLVLGCALLVASCGRSPGETSSDAAHTDDADAPRIDAPIDGTPDAGADTTSPALVTVTPTAGAATWLHERIRLVFDEPVTFTGTATATLAGAPLAAALVPDAPNAVAIAIDPAARGLGALAVHVAGMVRDAAGNPTPVAQDLTFEIPAWSGLPIDRGVAQAAPIVAVGDDGAVVAAWSVGALGARRVAVAVLDRGAWTPLGDLLGSGDAMSPAVAIDASARPLVGWCAGGASHVARWDGTAWIELASPGTGIRIALAGGATPTAAVFETGSATVVTLSSDAWQPLGAAIPLPAALTGDPALAVAAADRVAVGWIDAAARLRVYRYTGTWTALAPIGLGAPPTGGDHLSLAARGQTIAVAWDQWAGSFGVLAAKVTGTATAWTRLGHTLDVDVAGDAVAPAIALDATGAPIVAWTELIEGQQRGIVARYAGTAWTIVGGKTFLADAAAAPTDTRIALAAGDAPVVAYSAAGAIGVARFNGPAVAGVGLAARSSLAGCSISATSPPALLSQTGCFTLAGPGKPVPHTGLVPYDVVVELWSDYAKKRRWIGLPDGAPAMTMSGTGAWAPPNGTIMVKEFALEMTPGDPTTRRAIETRFLVKDPTLGWQGFSYQWRTDGSDATLQPDQALTTDWILDNGQVQPHVYPSRTHCLSCHENSYGPMLGLRPQQLQRWYDYNGTIADQLPTLAHLGIGPTSTAAPFISPHDPSETAEHRMRGYMAGNCAHCHNPNHISIKDLRYTTPLAQTRLCEVIVPGSPAQSVVYQKVSSRPGMPPLGTASVDPLAVAMLGTWITGMTSCP